MVDIYSELIKFCYILMRIFKFRNSDLLILRKIFAMLVFFRSFQLKNGKGKMREGFLEQNDYA